MDLEMRFEGVNRSEGGAKEKETLGLSRLESRQDTATRVWTQTRWGTACRGDYDPGSVRGTGGQMVYIHHSGSGRKLF